MITLILSNDLARVLHNNLIGLKCTVRSYTMATVHCLHDFNAYVVFAAGFTSFLQFCEGSIRAALTHVAISLVAFVEHEAVKAILVATGLCCAYA